MAIQYGDNVNTTDLDNLKRRVEQKKKYIRTLQKALEADAVVSKKVPKSQRSEYQLTDNTKAKYKELINTLNQHIGKLNSSIKTKAIPNDIYKFLETSPAAEKAAAAHFGRAKNYIPKAQGILGPVKQKRKAAAKKGVNTRKKNEQEKRKEERNKQQEKRSNTASKRKFREAIEKQKDSELERIFQNKMNKEVDYAKYDSDLSSNTTDVNTSARDKYVQSKIDDVFKEKRKYYSKDIPDAEVRQKIAQDLGKEYDYINKPKPKRANKSTSIGSKLRNKVGLTPRGGKAAITLGAPAAALGYNAYDDNSQVSDYLAGTAASAYGANQFNKYGAKGLLRAPNAAMTAAALYSKLNNGEIDPYEAAAIGGAGLAGQTLQSFIDTSKSATADNSMDMSARDSAGNKLYDNPNLSKEEILREIQARKARTPRKLSKPKTKLSKFGLGATAALGAGSLAFRNKANNIGQNIADSTDEERSFPWNMFDNGLDSLQGQAGQFIQGAGSVPFAATGAAAATTGANYLRNKAYDTYNYNQDPNGPTKNQALRQYLRDTVGSVGDKYSGVKLDTKLAAAKATGADPEYIANLEAEREALNQRKTKRFSDPMLSYNKQYNELLAKGVAPEDIPARIREMRGKTSGAESSVRPTKVSMDELEIPTYQRGLVKNFTPSEKLFNPKDIENINELKKAANALEDSLRLETNPEIRSRQTENLKQVLQTLDDYKVNAGNDPLKTTLGDKAKEVLNRTWSENIEAGADTLERTARNTLNTGNEAFDKAHATVQNKLGKLKGKAATKALETYNRVVMENGDVSKALNQALSDIQQYKGKASSSARKQLNRALKTVQSGAEVIAQSPTQAAEVVSEQAAKTNKGIGDRISELTNMVKKRIPFVGKSQSPAGVEPEPVTPDNYEVKKEYKKTGAVMDTKGNIRDAQGNILKRAEAARARESWNPVAKSKLLNNRLTNNLPTRSVAKGLGAIQIPGLMRQGAEILHGAATAPDAGKYLQETGKELASGIPEAVSQGINNYGSMLKQGEYLPLVGKVVDDWAMAPLEDAAKTIYNPIAMGINSVANNYDLMPVYDWDRRGFHEVGSNDPLQWNEQDFNPSDLTPEQQAVMAESQPVMSYVADAVGSKYDEGPNQPKPAPGQQQPTNPYEALASKYDGVNYAGPIGLNETRGLFIGRGGTSYSDTPSAADLQINYGERAAVNADLQRQRAAAARQAQYNNMSVQDKLAMAKYQDEASRKQYNDLLEQTKAYNSDDAGIRQAYRDANNIAMVNNFATPAQEQAQRLMLNKERAKHDWGLGKINPYVDAPNKDLPWNVNTNVFSDNPAGSEYSADYASLQQRMKDTDPAGYAQNKYKY